MSKKKEIIIDLSMGDSINLATGYSYIITVKEKRKRAHFIEMQDALFRINSCVVLPEGENPDNSEHQSLSSVGIIATSLRFAEENSGKKIFIAGHTDTSASVEFNQPLSEERSECVLSLLLIPAHFQHNIPTLFSLKS